VLPALVATAYGYRLVNRGAFVTVRGQPFRGDSPLGPQAQRGLASTDFAATATVDVGLLGGTAAVGTVAAVGTTSVLAGGAPGASIGSIAPGVGTAVGFGVGIGITWGLSTEQGKWVRGKLIEGTKAGIDYGKIFD
jgi:hypothetical protein